MQTKIQNAFVIFNVLVGILHICTYKYTLNCVPSVHLNRFLKKKKIKSNETVVLKVAWRQVTLR